MNTKLSLLINTYNYADIKSAYIILELHKRFDISLVTCSLDSDLIHVTLLYKFKNESELKSYTFTINKELNIILTEFEMLLSEYVLSTITRKEN